MSAEGAGREAVTVDALPVEAVKAAYAAYQRAWLTRNQDNPLFAEKVICDVLEAARPHLAAAEHARLQPELDRIEHDALARYEELAAAQAKAVAEAVAADRERLRGAYRCRRHGWEHCEDITCQMLADAVAAEREACAHLVGKHGYATAAALLRRGGEGGTDAT